MKAHSKVSLEELRDYLNSLTPAELKRHNPATVYDLDSEGSYAIERIATDQNGKISFIFTSNFSARPNY